MAASCMISNAPGTISDISDESHRALAFSIWGIGPMNGPVFGPVVGGFLAQYLGWRWTNWFVLIFGGVCWAMLFCVKESYAPAILKKRAEKRRQETGDERWWCRYDQKLSVVDLLKVNLTRPFVMTFTEPILWFWNLYIAVVYGMLYLCFVAYPIVYSQYRGWSLGLSGLAFCGIGLGGMIAIGFEPFFRKLINSHKCDPATGRVTPEAAVSAIIIASILTPVGQLWFAWTSLPVTIHPVWSILAGVPFGCGNALVFIYATNYIAGSYGIYSASALAGNSVVRSVFGGTLPLAGPAMYAALTPQWAGTMLGLLEVLLIPIPVVFYFKGAKIREKSRLIRQMKEDLEKSQKRAQKYGSKAKADREKAVMQDVEQNAAIEMETEPKAVNAALSEIK
jgi:MFS family permease